MTREEEWRKIILSINDSSFFDLMRNYLGKIETPFNKQDLISRLDNFFNREETKEKIIGILDKADVSLLTAISQMDGSSEKKLLGIFSDWTYLDLLNKIQNLEERFLIYKNGRNYYITPLFEDLFGKQVISPVVLINSREAVPGFDPPPWLNDPLMLAMLSFIQKNKNLIKIDGSIKKRGITELENVFPTIFAGKEGLKRFELLAKVLTNLNLVESLDGLIYINREQWDYISGLSEMNRYCLYYGAALAENNREIEEMALFFTRFFNNFPVNRSIEAESLNRYYKLYCESRIGNIPPFSLNRISETFRLLNIILDEDHFIRINGLLDFFHEEKHREPPLIIQPNFEITVKPFISLSESITPVHALEIKNYDLFSRFTLTRDSFLRAFDKGIGSDEILGILENLSRKEVPQNIVISLKDWEEDHKKAKLYRGIVLKVSEDKQMLIEQTDFLKPYICATLAPGVYLLDQTQEKLWMEALRELSISPLPASAIIKDSRTGINMDKDISLPAYLTLSERKEWSETGHPDNRKIDDHVKQLLIKLEKSGIQGDEKKELEARIKRKLIIYESQINRGIIRPEITEAKGMNFQGKIRLIESALHNKSDRLELSYYTADGVQAILVQPLEVLKDEKEKTLVGKILPDQEIINIKVSKISRVKKIRSSLF